MEIYTDEMRLEALDVCGGECFVIDGKHVLCIYKDPSLVLAAGEVAVHTQGPFLVCRRVDVENVQARSSVVRQADGRAYVVKFSPEPDGAGMARIELAEG